MSDQKIHVDIWGLNDPADFQPSGITIDFKFLGHILDARTYWHNGSGPVEDIPDDWQQDGVMVHTTHVTHGSVEFPVTLQSGRKVKVKFLTSDYPAGSGNVTLWVYVQPV